MSAAPVSKLSAEEYLEMDRAAELKSELHDGQVFPMVAVSFRHARIASGMSSAIRTRIRGKDCSEAIAPIRVRVSPSQFCYPDIVVVCGEAQLTDENVDTLVNPKVVVEVLSPSTEDYDYGGKFVLYRKLESLVEYLLVAQSEPKVEIFRKQSHSSWHLDTVCGLDASIQIGALGIEIPLAEIYEGIKFD